MNSRHGHVTDGQSFYTNPSLFLSFTVFSSIVYFFGHFLSNPPFENSPIIINFQFDQGVFLFLLSMSYFLGPVAHHSDPP